MLPEFAGRASAICRGKPRRFAPLCRKIRPHRRHRAQAFDIQLSECPMTELKADVLVLGAGMVGVGAALHLQKRGRDVILVDKHELAGEETSFGNAGMIESASVFPYMFPRD